VLFCFLPLLGSLITVAAFAAGLEPLMFVGMVMSLGSILSHGIGADKLPLFPIAFTMLGAISWDPNIVGAQLGLAFWSIVSGACLTTAHFRELRRDRIAPTPVT
jgi:hypothetical protein